jgi:hypothetical protein
MIHLWTQNETLMSSTWREAQTILLYLRIHALRFKGGKLKWYSDNQGVPPILHKGSMKPDLNLIAMGILQLCIEHDIQISVDWIPRDQNAVADTLSKLIDSDDWAIANNVFQLINNKYGPFTLDPFASSTTAKVEKFYSRFWCPGSQGVDAFAYSWANENCWIVPPPKIVHKVLQHMKICKARGVMIIPRWQSAISWPLLHNGQSWEPGVTKLMEYQNPKNFFVSAPGGNDAFSPAAFKGNVLILGLDFHPV